MSFDIAVLAKKVIALGAPLIGEALLGPLGATAGNLLAQVLGASDSSPAAINEAIDKTDPVVVSQALGEADAKWAEAIKAEAEAAGILATQIGETSRAEIMSDDPYVKRARPTISYVFAFAAVMFTMVIVIAIVLPLVRFGANDAAAVLLSVGGLISALAMFLGVVMVPVTGFVASRGREKQAAITGEPQPGVVQSIIGAFKR